MVRAKSQVPGQGSQGLRPESDVWTGEPNLEGFPTSLGFHLLSAETVSSFCLDTDDEVPVLIPIAYPISRSQSTSPSFLVLGSLISPLKLRRAFLPGYS